MQKRDLEKKKRRISMHYETGLPCIRRTRRTVKLTIKKWSLLKSETWNFHTETRSEKKKKLWNSRAEISKDM